MLSTIRVTQEKTILLSWFSFLYLLPDIILITILYRESEIDLPLVAIFEAGAGIGGSREGLLLLGDKGLLRKGKHHRVGNCTDLLR